MSNKRSKNMGVPDVSMTAIICARNSLVHQGSRAFMVVLLRSSWEARWINDALEQLEPNNQRLYRLVNDHCFNSPRHWYESDDARTALALAHVHANGMFEQAKELGEYEGNERIVIGVDDNGVFRLDPNTLEHVGAKPTLSATEKVDRAFGELPESYKVL
jgi:hypothetical protein